MGTGTLIRTVVLSNYANTDKTKDTSPDENPNPDEQIRQQMLSENFGPEFHFKSDDVYFANPSYFHKLDNAYPTGTDISDWSIQEKSIRTVYSVWDSPKLTKLLSQPVGSPIDLTLEEADEIVRLAAGRRPDLPRGIDFVENVRELLGHSLIEKLDKSENR